MLDDQILALDAATLAGIAQQFFRERGHEARPRQTQTAEFLGVDQTAGAVVAEYEVIPLDDVGTCAGFRGAKMVANHFEHQIVRGQGKHDHDQSAFTGRVDETVDGGVQVPLQSEIALRLALLGTAEHRVQLIDRLARHE